MESGASLNDVLLVGPNLYPRLTSVIIAFRWNRIAMSADIGKMFQEIAISPEEKDFHCSLMTNKEGRAEDWRMKRLTFGVAPSPFLATRVNREAAAIYRCQYPLASRALCVTCTWMDRC